MHIIPNRILAAGLLVLATCSAQTTDERQLIAVLQSTADAPTKCAACTELAIHGTAISIPALAAQLGTERVGHAARHALETMPYPEALATLRQALPKSTGDLRLGLIDSLGNRQDRLAVPLLAPLLADKDQQLIAATATALGKIGTPEAMAALRNTPPPAPTAVWEAMLVGAEQRLAADDADSARAVYQQILASKAPAPIRHAAWRGLVLADEGNRSRRIMDALTGTDAGLRAVAAKVVRETPDPLVVAAGLKQWDALDAQAQIALLDAATASGANAPELLAKAASSQHTQVRAAAWQTAGQSGSPAVVPVLAHAAAGPESAETEAARDALSRLHGPGVEDALLRHLENSPDPEKAAILLALGERRQQGAAEALIRYAKAPQKPVRLAALDALHSLAAPATLAPLLELAAASSGTGRKAASHALEAVCRNHPDKDAATQQTLASLARLTPEQRGTLLPLLAELATTAAKDELLRNAKGTEAPLAREALRALADWPDAHPVEQLLVLTRNATDPVSRTLALRAAIAVCAHEADRTRRVVLLRQSLDLADRVEEKRDALSRLSEIPCREALETALACVEQPDLTEEAGTAVVAIAEKLAQGEPELVAKAVKTVLDSCRSPAITQRAWALRTQTVAPGPFIRDWQVCGPYGRTAASGALAIFDIPFGPEKPGTEVQWYATPSSDSVPLIAFFPGETNCVAYLKAEIAVPRDTDAMLLMGSDDGIKAWLNGEVVHANNVDRGQIADQDMARVRLKQGANALMLKVTQGGGGWSSCARLVGADGQPIQGLAVTRPQGVPPIGTRKPAAPKEVVARPSSLPARDAFRRLRLAEQFYAEGAYYGDFNRDGKMDIVAGPFWYAGPDFQARHEYRPLKTFDPKGYSDNFLTFTGDFDNDGWTDILCVPFPGKEGFWYANPQGKEGHWQRHLAHSSIGDESPAWGDITGDGHPELLFCIDGYLGYAGPDPKHPDQPWVFHAISGQDKRYQRFTHGLGYGDIDGDGKTDVLEAVGWWQQTDTGWTFHPTRFAEAAAQMLVADVDGDSLADVITTWHCHRYGLVWYRQLRDKAGRIDWEKHEILTPVPDLESTDLRVSQLHALSLVDMNADGLPDILTGKRFWSHGPTGDVEPDAPAVVLWFELRREGGKAAFVPHLVDNDSGVGTQVAATDLNGDRLPDVIVANKRGIYVHLTEAANGKR